MKPAFLVDGVTEQKFIQTICKDRPVKIINCNGDSVSAEAIAKRAASLIRLWGGRCFPIVILVDRESRGESAENFCATLVDSIRDEGIEDQLIVGVADRMIENWMLGDPDIWPDAEDLDDVDGFRGSSVVKQRMPEYGKAANGPSLLARCKASAISLRSRSFRTFIDQLSLLRCAWLRR
ncbi:DUF4276 family protein [Luteimonas marina]|uniref:DUF4276 family protein n=1 Tax=Luteimonas marina TaxID=488485 RepID=A0A5C5UC76_9GAMM|nr:DUF4276 family protein [Luteimonas marina]TWT23546.1 DUF4276 family protein [Luteimonas marina]